jgi:hypothetical protein
MATELSCMVKATARNAVHRISDQLLLVMSALPHNAHEPMLYTENLAYFSHPTHFQSKRVNCRPPNRRGRGGWTLSAGPPSTLRDVYC